MDKGGERVLVAAMKRIIEEADGLSGVLGGGGVSDVVISSSSEVD
jgi:hypothetical protein